MRSFGNMLRFVVSAWAADGPDHDITGTASLRDFKSLRSCRRNCLDQLIVEPSILKVVPSTQMRCRTTARRRARATIARLRPRRLATREAHVAGDACAPATVDLGLLDPVVQRVRRAPDLCGNRRDRLPTRTVLAFAVENHPHGALAHFRGKLVRGLDHDAPSYSGVGASGKLGAVQ